MIYAKYIYHDPKAMQRLKEPLYQCWEEFDRQDNWVLMVAADMVWEVREDGVWWVLKNRYDGNINCPDNRLTERDKVWVKQIAKHVKP